MWPGSWDFSRGTDPAVFAELAALGVDRIVVSSNEAGSTSIDAVAGLTARLLTVLDDISA